MVHQVGVEGVVAGNQDAERVLGSAAGAPQLLPHRGTGAGEAGHQHRVEAADVDAELEGVGRGKTDDLAGAQGRLECTPLLREVAPAVRGDPAGQQRVDLGEQGSGGQRHVFDAAPGPDEGQRVHVFRDQVGEQVSGLGGGGAAGRCVVLAGVRREGRLPQRHRDLASWRTVTGHGQHVQAGEPARRQLGLGHGGGGQDERGGGAVGGAQPTQPTYDVGDMGAEDAAVVVTLVDHDVLQRAQEPGPALVAGEERTVQHVGVGEDVLSMVARPVALLVAAVAVVGGDPYVETERTDRGHLVVGQGLRRGEVEDGRAAPVPDVALLTDRRECWQQVGE